MLSKELKKMQNGIYFAYLICKACEGTSVYAEAWYYRNADIYNWQCFSFSAFISRILNP